MKSININSIQSLICLVGMILFSTTNLSAQFVGGTADGYGSGSSAAFDIMEKATVTTQAVTEIGGSTATGNGNITDLGLPSPSQYGMCWNTSGSPTISDNTTQEGAATTTGSFTSTLKGLSNCQTYYVRAYATNDAGTAYGEEVSFTTLDETNPVITSTHSNQTLYTDENCEVELPDYTVDLEATDNCDDNLTITQSPEPGTMLSGHDDGYRTARGSGPPPGVSYKIVLTATDDAGNSSSKKFTVSVVDNVNPKITSTHENQTLFVDHTCTVSLPDYTTDMIVTDNCSETILTRQSPEPGTVYDLPSGIFAINVSLYATDETGNISAVTFSVSIKDNTSPEILSSHPDEEISAEKDGCTAPLSDYTEKVEATDLCDEVLDISQIPAPKTSISGATNTITLTATDDYNNTAQVTFNVAVKETNPPQITSHHADKEIAAGADCNASLPDYTTEIEAEDCDKELDISQIPAPGTTISGATNSITLTVTDDFDNSSDVSFNVSVTDQTIPDIACIKNQTIDLEPGNSTYTVQGDEFDLTVSTDNCGIASTSNDFNDETTLDGAELLAGETTIIWTVTDNAGNESTCSFDVTVIDHTGISELSPKGISVYPNPTKGEIYIDFNENYIEKVTVSDLTGKTLIEKTKVLQNETFDLSKYSYGMYIISIHTQGEVLKTKVMKSR